MKFNIVIVCFYLLLPGLCFSQVNPTNKAKGKISISKIKKEDFEAASGQEEKSKEREGPANITFSLASQIDSDYDFSDDYILNIFDTIYRDANLNSGYYYYLPASYNLSWSKLNGKYDFNVNYGLGSEGGRGETTVTAILKPRLNRNELRLAEELLKQNIKAKPEAEFGVTELIAMPMAQTPEVEFTNLAQFDVEERDISIRAPSDLQAPVYISFTTSRIDDLMSMFFNNIGLYGDIVIYPDGEDMPTSIRIPFNLKIDDPKTYGKFELDPGTWRGGWQNMTDYPVLLTHFHVMKKEPDGNVKVYTWLMGDKEVPENAKVKFDANLVPRWIDTNSKIEKIWMDYSVLSCRSCNAAVKDKIFGGSKGPRVKKLEFTILTPLEFTGADLMKIKLRSYQADPNGMSKVDLPSLTITEDGQTLSGGELFIPDGASPEFEYLIQIYMADGTKYVADHWVKSNDLEVVIGQKQIEESISYFR